MISTREFCREREFPYTIILTYSFDPIFFERIPLQDLQRGGSRRTLIIADGGELRAALSQCADQISFLGRRYVLAEAASSGIFHPKLIARLSPDGGRVWIGTGNVTYSGWGGNQELGVAWTIGPRAEDKGSWLLPLLDKAGKVVRSSVYHDQLEDIRDRVGWLDQTASVLSLDPVVVGTPEMPLAPQLAERWRGRSFDEVKICTGSTDKEGAFLRWAHATFGIKRAMICVNPSQAAFIPARLSKLPLKIEIIEPKLRQMMHAKFYWFSGPDSYAAVLGSANCSAAGWLSPGGLGNYELIVPYDAPSPEDFDGVLQLFNEQGQSPEAVLHPRPEKIDEEQEPAPAHELVSLRLRRNRSIDVVVNPPLPAGSSAVLVIQAGRRSTEVPLKEKGDDLSGRLTSDFEVGVGTSFGHLIIETGDRSLVTPQRWIDNDAALTHAGREPLDFAGLDGLRAVPSSSNQEGILAAVYSVAQSLLKGRAAAVGLATLSSGRQLSKRAKPSWQEEEDLRPVDPAAIIRGLGELRATKAMSSGASIGSHGTSLLGIMALLFGREEPEEEDLSIEALSGEEDPNLKPATKPGATTTPVTPKSSQSPPSNGAATGRFNEQIDQFLDGLGQSEFSQSCDAERLIQALAFPLLVCVRGLEGGWVSHSTLASVGCRVVDTMFGRQQGANSTGGLFNLVRARYEASGRLEEFVGHVGDGTLWAALLASLCLPIGRHPRQYVLQAIALSRVYHCAELVAHASPEQLSDVVQTLVVPNAELSLTQRVEHVIAAIAQIVEMLNREEGNLYALQGNGRRWHEAGSLLWSSKWGWLVTAPKPAQSTVPGYVNVGSACKDMPDLQELMQELEAAFRPPKTALTAA
jgi:hypothetical protein